MEFAASFSGGKDSSLAIKRMLDKGHRIVAIIVSSKKDMISSWTHNIEREYFKKASEILRCEIIFTDTDVENYEINFEKALMKSKKLGAQSCIFGDIDIVEHIEWNNMRCKNSEIECIHPLLFENRENIVNSFIKTGIKAKIVKVDSKKLPEELIGELYDKKMIDKFKKLNIDSCGENGEFHTRVELSSLRDALFKEIYVDNASTAFPKAPTVGKAISEFIDNNSFSINRGSYMKSYELSSKVIDVRDSLLRITNAPKGYSCIFSPSATELINTIIRGSLKCGDEIIVDDRLHNSAWRTIRALDSSITTKIWCSDYKIEHFNSLINNRTKVVFLTLVDNITGFYNESVAEIGRICEDKGIILVIDAVQAICERKVDLNDLKADVLIFSSHIGLMGPEGIAEMLIKDESAKKIKALIYGGTGSQSNSPDMPFLLPDKFEAGTLNLPGVIATGAALDFIDSIGIDRIIEKKHSLGKMLRDGLSRIKELEVRGYGSFCSVMVKGQDDAMIAFNLDMIKHIMCRVGIQCSPCAHMSEGTFPNGSIRFTLGYFNNEYDVKYIIESMKELLVV